VEVGVGVVKAKMSSSQLGETNSRINSNRVLQFVSVYSETNAIDPFQAVREFVSLAKVIVLSSSREKIFMFMIGKNVASAKEIVESLGLPRQSVYRHLKKLENINFLEKIVKARHYKGATGRRPSIYGVKGIWTHEQVAEASDRYNQLIAPSYTVVKNLTNQILEEYCFVKTEIRYKDVRDICRENCQGFYSPDISAMVSQNLKEKGIKIWR